MYILIDFGVQASVSKNKRLLSCGKVNKCSWLLLKNAACMRGNKSVQARTDDQFFRPFLYPASNVTSTFFKPKMREEKRKRSYTILNTLMKILRQSRQPRRKFKRDT